MVRIVEQLLNAACVAELALASTDKVLDVGCGDGALTALIAARAAAVLAIDRSSSAEIVARAAAAGFEFRRGEATALPLHPGERGRFDVAHARFVLESQRDALPVVCSMVDAVRPGGRVVLADDDHAALSLWPPVPEFERVWRRYATAFDEAGNDARAGAKLVQLLGDAGARPRKARSLSFGCCAGEPEFPAAIARLGEVVASVGLEAGVVRAGTTALREFAARRDATIWYVLRWAEATVTAARPA